MTMTGNRRRAGFALVGAAVAAALTAGTIGASSNAFPGSRGRIAYFGYEAGSYELFTMRSDGSDVRRLTMNAVYDYSPRWSPDGTKLAFIRGAEDARLYTMNADGSRVRRLEARTACCGSDRSPAWSPDGTKLVFVSYRRGRSRLYVIGADGGEARPLEKAPDLVGEPSWSPDGLRLVVSGYGRLRYGRRHFGLFIIDPKDGAVRRSLARDWASGRALAPAWSPNGRNIAFVHVHECDPPGRYCEAYDVYVTTADGRSRTLVRTDAHSPAWSPDGTALLFVDEGRILALDLRYGHTVDLGAGSDPDWQPRCHVLGSVRPDRLRDTGRRQLVCGLAGDDVVVARRGETRVFAGAGNDTISARNRRFDLISCGPGTDAVNADRFDHVATDCERVSPR